jgi:hypothetical protein
MRSLLLWVVLCHVLVFYYQYITACCPIVWGQEVQEDVWPQRMGSIHCPEILVTNEHMV